MNVSVILHTSSPIPANSTFYDITSILTSWSISDGVQTISSSNGVLNPNFPPAFSTDSNGVITNFIFLLVLNPQATVIGDTDSFIAVTSDTVDILDVGAVNAPCNQINNSFCIAWSYPQVSSGLIANQPGVWMKSATPPIAPTSVPSLMTWDIFLLVLLLLFVTPYVRKNITLK